MKIISNFAVFEGGDGSGTTTQLSLLTERFKTLKKPVFYPTFEPTDGQIGKIIRAALKEAAPVENETLAMLFAADRNEHLYKSEGIIERAKRGELVISDRFALSSLVYQGIDCAASCGGELPGLLNWRFPAPEMTIFLDVEPEIAISRMKGRAELEIYEYLDFQRMVRARYRSVIEIYREKGAKVEIIDACKSAREVADQVWSIICQMPIFNV
ncbi:MAG: dTMP kinase [Treponema sp.]|jgi:dTMP kinase|nr:dTMP kinase [Treponema sp.]